MDRIWGLNRWEWGLRGREKVGTLLKFLEGCLVVPFT